MTHLALRERETQGPAAAARLRALCVIDRRGGANADLSGGLHRLRAIAPLESAPAGPFAGFEGTDVHPGLRLEAAIFRTDGGRSAAMEEEGDSVTVVAQGLLDDEAIDRWLSGQARPT